MKKKFSFIAVLKGEHKYYFRYPQGQEKEIFYHLIAMGKEKNVEIKLVEVLQIIRIVSTHLREKGYLKSISLTIPLNAA